METVRKRLSTCQGTRGDTCLGRCALPWHLAALQGITGVSEAGSHPLRHSGGRGARGRSRPCHLVLGTTPPPLRRGHSIHNPSAKQGWRWFWQDNDERIPRSRPSHTFPDTPRSRAFPLPVCPQLLISFEKTPVAGPSLRTSGPQQQLHPDSQGSSGNRTKDAQGHRESSQKGKQAGDQGLVLKKNSVGARSSAGITQVSWTPT